MARNAGIRAAVAAVAVLSLSATAAGAQTATKSQDQPSSTWTVPGTLPLDGLGAFLALTAPPAGPAQGSLLGYEYTLVYGLQGGSVGVLALGARNGQKVAGFGLIPDHPVVTVPFEWSFGHVYFLYTKRLDATRWAAWVLDWSSGAWTFIGLQTAAVGAGGIVPTSLSTWVDYDGSLGPPTTADQSTCGFYPGVDAYFYPPIGYRGTAMSTATLTGDSVVKGDCPSTTSAFNGWRHYQLGTTAP
jgi:hypothetical protein